MSGAGFQFAAEKSGTGHKGRSPLAHLVHALNQPLTGLQCSLELALVGPRRSDQYVQTIREGLDLTSRMRGLVEAIRELADLQQAPGPQAEWVELDRLLRETVADLLPVAEARQVRLQVQEPPPLPIRGDQHLLTALTFRLLESILSLTRENCVLEISASNQREQACVDLSWVPGPRPKHSPFSPPELGLLIAQAGWEQAGAAWVQSRTEDMQSCSIRLPLASTLPPLQVQSGNSGDLKGRPR
jgi:signal transduction histidine kinase